MNKMWVSLSGANVNFWKHEYNKHGYCYALKTKSANGPRDYFMKSIELFTRKPFARIMKSLPRTANNK